MTPTTEADKVAELVAKLRAFHKNGVDMVGVDLTFLANAASELSRLSAEVDRLNEECQQSMLTIAAERARAEAAEAQLARNRNRLDLASHREFPDTTGQ